MASVDPTQYNCSICGKEVSLKTCKTDGRGHLVHEFCYCLQLTNNPELGPVSRGPDLLEGRVRSWKEIAIDVLGEKNPHRFQELVEELDLALAIREFNKGAYQPAATNPSRLLPSTRTAHEKILDVAVRLMHSDYASLQMLFPDRGESGQLRLLAFRGFNPQAARFWEWVRADSKSTCGMALRDAKRVIAPDITACDFMADSEDQKVYLQTGIYACQTTPLITRRGNIVGMISTHWRTPHHPSPADLCQLDILARQAADLIERSRRE
jgi:GAF domain-containing protein